MLFFRDSYIVVASVISRYADVAFIDWDRRRAEEEIALERIAVVPCPFPHFPFDYSVSQRRATERKMQWQ
jgi:hypothetical protein